MLYCIEKMSVLYRLADISRNIFMRLLNTTIPYIYLKLKDLHGISIYFPSDAFGALEENLMTKNIYFDSSSIANADTIIDLGAHAGSFTVYAILYSRPGTRIIAVEPDKTNYMYLLANIQLLQNIIGEKKLEILVLNKAVWHKKARLPFNRTSWSEGGHLSEAETFKKGVFVDTITLDELIELSKGRIIVKMDIEGAEMPVLTDSKKLYRVNELAIEAHGDHVFLIKTLKLFRYDCKVLIYKINPQLFKLWLNIKPGIYGFLVALYRVLASSMFPPTVLIVKAIKRS
jgi:FkbM family methyltransferase